LCCANSLTAAICKFKFFPSASELVDFFEAFKASEPEWRSPDTEFEIPHELTATFGAWRKSIGVSAFTTWMRGAKAWVRTDGSIMIEAATPLCRKWIISNFVSALEEIAETRVIVTCIDPNEKRYWPHGGPIGGTLNAWWQTRNATDCSTDETAEYLSALDTWQQVTNSQHISGSFCSAPIDEDE